MVDSEVPIQRERAREELITLLEDNIADYSPPDDDRALIMGGWKLLCETYLPIFLEKSPHHLCQWSALELIVDCMDACSDIDFLLVGLVRNPMDTVYSQFRRWRMRPEQIQYQWLAAYQNLQKLKGMVGEDLLVVRYEDIIASLDYLQPVFKFCDVDIAGVDHDHFHRQSIAKWREDKSFGFVLSDEVVMLAESYGYKKEELTNECTLLWPVYRETARVTYKMENFLRRFARKLLRSRT